MHSFQKGKIPHPGGFTLHSFISFSELHKNDILKVARESQRNGKVLCTMNTTLITLIPKKQKGESFEDLRPISCCKKIYKFIAKTKAQRLKPIQI